MSKTQLEKKLCFSKDSPDPVFELSNCGMKQIPGIFSVIKVLRKESLYLQNNKLSSLKNGGNLCDLSFLRLLDLSLNKFKELPSDIKYLKNLQILRIDHNELVSLPAEIGCLSNLEQLTASSNKLKSLPDSICNLSKLKLLDIRKNNLFSLPMTIYQNRNLESLLLDEDREWSKPPKVVVEKGIQAILSYFRQENNVSTYEHISVQDVPAVTSNLDQLNLYDKQMQDNLRRLEKEKKKKVLQKIKSEISILDQKEKELSLHKQNQNEKQKMLLDMIAQQKKIDEQVFQCQKLRQLEHNKFVEQLQNVKTTADNVIEQLLQTNNIQKQQSIASWLSPFVEDIPVKQNFNRQEILESMEKLLADEYSLLKKFEENDTARRNTIETFNLKEEEFKLKIENLLSKRKEERNGVLNSLKQDRDLQYAAVLILLEKSDSHNIELQNQIAIVQNQLSNLTALELQNKKMYLNNHINEIAKRRMVLSELLADIFERQQAYQQQLIEHLRDVKNRQSFKNKNEYWLLQYQRLLNSSYGYLSEAVQSVNPLLVSELALIGLSHYAPLLSTLKCQSVEDFSKISDKDLKNAGVESRKDRFAILNEIHQYMKVRISSEMLPTAPSLDKIEVLSTCESPTAPSLHELEASVSSLSEVLQNECVICMERQSHVVFLPCGHSCTCSYCSVSIKMCPDRKSVV